MKKKLVFLLLVCVFLCAAMSTAIATDYQTTNNGVVYGWNDNDGHAFVYGYNGTDTHITIESVIEGKPVTSIYQNAFKDCTILQNITLPNSITRISGFAFENCTGLQSITIPNSVIEIGGRAFANCDSLQSVTIPNSVLFLYLDAFFECTNLKDITFEGIQPPYFPNTSTNLWELKTISVPLGGKTAYQNAVGAGNTDKVVEYMPVVQESPSDAFNIRLITTEIPADEHRLLEVGAKQEAAEVFGIPASAVGMELKDWKLELKTTGDGEWMEIKLQAFVTDFPDTYTDGKMPLSVPLPAAAKSKNVAVIHQVNGAWKVEDSSVVNDKIIVSMNSLSPVAIVWAEDVAIDLPKTGDDSNVILWSALACISLFGVIALVSKRKEA